MLPPQRMSPFSSAAFLAMCSGTLCSRLTPSPASGASPKSVARAFSAAQERLLERSPRRPLEPKNLALFDFVAGQRKNPLPQLTWPQLLKEWNARIRRKWHYADFRSMRRDFERTAKLVTDPDFRGVERVSPGKRSGPKAPTA